MDERDYIKNEITRLQTRLAEIDRTRLKEKPVASKREPDDNLPDYVIEFDGGSSCNIPALGYGEGYGSFQINEWEIKRVKFGKGHSANSAEIRTLAAALSELAATVRTSDTTVLVRGDSQIALKWVSCQKMPKQKTSEGFREAIILLRVEVAKFKHVSTEWRGRAHSVALFGH